MNPQPPSPTPWSRRTLLQHLALAAAAGVVARPGTAAPTAAPGHDALEQSGFPMGSERIAILVYPEFTALDALGPHYPLAGMMGATVRFVARTRDPVVCEGASSGGFAVHPHWSFADCPENLDLLLVPGGLKGTLATLSDSETLAFIEDRGRKARLTASVCTGSMLLGAVGLLQGRRATSHWQLVPVLKEAGAIPVSERIVFDGDDRVTAAGVSAGLDLGFTLVRRYRGDAYAQGMQLLGEYDPQPPFPKAGNPRTAPTPVVDLLNNLHAPIVEEFRNKVKRAREKH